MSEKVIKSLFPFRFFREPHGCSIVVGPWMCSLNWAKTARFANGSRWFSGWRPWRDPRTWGE